jgi:hypothetical protein
MFLKDPEALLEYRVDWGAALGPSAEIATSNWEVRPAEAGGVSVTGTGLAGLIASARLGGGVPGHVYVVGNRILLADGTSDERSLTIRVEDR